MQRESSVDALVSTLEDLEEHRMVRHEAAESLGSPLSMLYLVDKLVISYIDNLNRSLCWCCCCWCCCCCYLGAIGGSRVDAVLQKYKDDPDLVVMQSCEVALDAISYWANPFNAETL